MSDLPPLETAKLSGQSIKARHCKIKHDSKRPSGLVSHFEFSEKHVLAIKDLATFQD